MVEDTRVILQALARSSFDALMARPGALVCAQALRLCYRDTITFEFRVFRFAGSPGNDMIVVDSKVPDNMHVL